MSELFYKQYKIFVSSPCDVEEERGLVDVIISHINETIGESLKVNLKVVKWENMPPETTNESIQERLNRKIADCNFFLLILYKRYGRTEKGHTISNTEREINTILSHLQQNKQKTILSYFKELDPNTDPGKQEIKVRDLKKRLAANNMWLYSNYKDIRDFERKLTHNLYRILLRMNFSSFKIEQLKKFWKVGRVDGQTVPKISIVYPPVPKIKMSDGLSVNLWQKRLLPHIYFEDYKALHKILKNLSMVGHKDYKVYSKHDLPEELEQSNVVWICLPRLMKGLKELKNQSGRKFDINIPAKATDTAECFINWTTQTGEKINVRSPLRKYLEQQRPDIDPESDWNKSLNNVIVKDYAIIARFDRDTLQSRLGTERLKAFYIAGIHGLGTWGAAWFIDRCYGAFKDISGDGDIQMLVEVEYRNGRIVSVKDVSNKSQDYFKTENSAKKIKNNIQLFKEDFE